MKIVTAAIIKKGDKYLITQRAIDDKLPLKWEFPGGKVEKGETPEECLKREIKEELNLNIKIGARVATNRYMYDSGEIMLLAYSAEIVGGSMKLMIHNDAKWVGADELKHFDFCPADINILERIRMTKNKGQLL